jgi:hypothetical protein
MRGGKRPNAGRKKGVKIGHIKPQTVCYHRRIPPEIVEPMDKYLKELKATKNPSKIN